MSFGRLCNITLLLLVVVLGILKTCEAANRKQLQQLQQKQCHGQLQQQQLNAYGNQQLNQLDAYGNNLGQLQLNAIQYRVGAALEEQALEARLTEKILKKLQQQPQQQPLPPEPVPALPTPPPVSPEPPLGKLGLLLRSMLK